MTDESTRSRTRDERETAAEIHGWILDAVSTTTDRRGALRALVGATAQILTMFAIPLSEFTEQVAKWLADIERAKMGGGEK